MTKKTLMLCGAGLTLWASAALAGLELTWNACNVDGGASNVNVNCVGGGPYQLVGCLQPEATMNGFFAVDIYIDLLVEEPVLPAFWHFEAAGCNPSGLHVSGDRSAVGGGCTADTPWDASVTAEITAYGAGSRGEKNRGRLLLALMLPNGSSALTAGQNYYLFHVDIITSDATEAGGPCSGCADKVAINWIGADLYNDGTIGPGFSSLTDPGPNGSCVGWNGPSPATCSATPTRNRTWGSIKAMYR